MAERRMYTKKITDSDAFIEMSSAAQALYMHLNQGADDDGFNNQVSNAMFKAHASVDDLKVLMVKNFIIRFASGVIVIKHWRMHNTLRKDRYTPTNFQEELKQLGIKDNGAYTLGCQVVAKRLPQDSIGKVSIVEDSKEEVRKDIVSKYVGIEESAHSYVKSYEEIMSDCCVEEEVRPMLWEFIKHCQANGHTLINSKLTSIILALDFAYGNSPHKKIASLRKVINSGHYDVLENNKS